MQAEIVTAYSQPVPAREGDKRMILPPGDWSVIKALSGSSDVITFSDHYLLNKKAQSD